MTQILYDNRCKCKEEISVIKEQKSSPNKKKEKKRRVEKPVLYPNQDEITSKSFQIKYERNLSPFSKFLLNSFQKKYLFYAIDDILYLLKSNPMEQENLLTILYSPVLSLQNNLYINFFDIWIQEIYINENKTKNKFLMTDFKNSETISYITIKLFYRTKRSVKKQESLW